MVQRILKSFFRDVTYMISAWLPSTHHILTSTSIDLVSTLYPTWCHTYKDLVSVYSCLPDVEEDDMMSYTGHFYNPMTRRSYIMGCGTNCKKRFLDHFNRAVNDTDELVSAQELGRALHYITDICVPHHAQNKIAFLSNHLSYEHKALDIDIPTLYFPLSNIRFRTFDDIALESYKTLTTEDTLPISLRRAIRASTMILIRYHLKKSTMID